jgi:hypothetical protein
VAPWVGSLLEDVEYQKGRECKRSWSGSRVGEGFPVAFGQLLDHARALAFLDKPDYSHFRHLFRTVFESRGFQHNAALDWSAVEVPALPGEIMTVLVMLWFNVLRCSDPQ